LVVDSSVKIDSIK